jgi:hypothetical protein
MLSLVFAIGCSNSCSNSTSCWCTLRTYASSVLAAAAAAVAAVMAAAVAAVVLYGAARSVLADLSSE